MSEKEFAVLNGIGGVEPQIRCDPQSMAFFLRDIFMATNKLILFTPSLIEQLPVSTSPETEYTDAESSGLKIVVTRKGRKLFRMRYTLSGNKRSMDLGDFPALDLNKARQMAQEIREQARQGIDPKAAKQIEKVMPSFKQFCIAVYLPLAQQHKRSWGDDASKINGYLLERFGETPINQVKVADIQKYLADLRNVHGLAPATVNRHRALLSKMFSIAIDHELLIHNPCSRVAKLTENNRVERFLNAEEMARIIDVMRDALKQGQLNKIAVAAFLVLLFTGARKREVLDMQWKDINFEAQSWYLKFNKSGKARHVPLSSEAIAVLQSIEPLTGCAYVFPNLQTGKPIRDPRKSFHHILDRAGIEQFRIHDLRHSFASQAVNSGASLYTVQLLLGHASPVTTQRYAHLQSETLLNASEKIAETMVSRASQQQRAEKFPAKSTSTSSKLVLKKRPTILNTES